MPILRRGVLAAFVAAVALMATTVPAHAATKPTVVLVHGAFADASGWAGVISILQGQGYPVIAAPEPAARRHRRRRTRPDARLPLDRSRGTDRCSSVPPSLTAVRVWSDRRRSTSCPTPTATGDRGLHQDRRLPPDLRGGPARGGQTDVMAASSAGRRSRRFGAAIVCPRGRRSPPGTSWPARISRSAPISSGFMATAHGRQDDRVTGA